MERHLALPIGFAAAFHAALLFGFSNPPPSRFQPSPIYPFEGKKDALKGEVLVEFRVDEAGRVNDARVIRSSHRMFEAPTLRAVARWQFEPRRRAGRTVSFKMALPVIFHIED